PDGSDLSLVAGGLTPQQEAQLERFGQRIDNSPVSSLVLNTGRSWIATEFLCSAIRSDKLHYALVEHGCELWDVRSGQQVDLEYCAAQSPDPAVFAGVLASRQHIRHLIEWFVDDGARQLCDELKFDGQLRAQLDKSWNLTFGVPHELEGDHVYATLQQLVARQPDLAGEFVFHYSRWNRYLDVMGTMDKGAGLALTMSLLEQPLDYSAAIGDGLNDIAMLEKAALPVCPANAEAAVRELCSQRGFVSQQHFVDATLDWLNTL
ncbi:MAG: HAD hydrolase family protein, partial [Pseudomonadota bacterium]